MRLRNILTLVLVWYIDEALYARVEGLYRALAWYMLRWTRLIKKRNPFLIILMLFLTLNIALTFFSKHENLLGSPSEPSILVYSDELESENLQNRPPLVALRNLEYPYTAVANHYSFQDLLISGGPWDLVIYNEELYVPPETVYDALDDYLKDGGRAAITTWNMDKFSDNPLWTTLGVVYAEKLMFTGEMPIYPWEQSHPIFTNPNPLPNPLRLKDSEGFGVDGILVNASGTSKPIAGKSTSPNANEALIVVRNDGKAIFNGILTGLLNLDGEKTEGVKFWENEIQFLLGATVKDFDELFASNGVRMIYPSDNPSKPLGCLPAMVSDWLASMAVSTKLTTYTEGLDTDGAYVNQITGRPMGAVGEGIVSFGGPVVNPVVRYAESGGTPAEDRAPIRFHDEGGVYYFQHWNGEGIPGASLPIAVINGGQDMFVIEVYKDGDGRNEMLCYGFGWKGTYAAGKYFEGAVYPNLTSYDVNWIIVKWEDTNGDGFVNGPRDSDTYTTIATG